MGHSEAAPEGAPLAKRASPFAETGDFAGAILDALDCGVVMTTLDLRAVVLANEAGRAMLEAFGAGPGRLPPPVRAALGAQCADDLPRDGFTRAVAVVAPMGQRFFVRARQVPRAPLAALVVLASEALRHGDLVSRLARGHGLSRRQAECAALAYAGLRNREVALRLRISEGRVEQYLVEVYERLGVKSRTTLAALIRSWTTSPGADDGRA